MIAPSRKIIATTIICIALVGSVAYVKLFRTDSTVSDNGFLTTIELPELDVPIYAIEDTSDTDNDGLKDWQEIIQGTDVANPDSDGDGTTDGDEIATGRNPLKKGPDDKGHSTAELIIKDTEIYSAYTPRSLTDNVSKDLFSAYIQAKNQGSLGTDGKALNDIARSLAEETLSKNEIVEKYTIAAIGTFPDNDLESGLSYGERFGTLYIEMLEAIESSPSDLDIIAEHFQAFSRDITALYVPQSLASTQAEIGNNFYNLALMFYVISDSEKDPIKATLAVRNMKRLFDEQSTLFTSVANYFRRNDIMFENQDIQRLWLNI